MNIKIIKSNRKTLALSVDDELCAVVKAPYFVSDNEISDFINKHKIWLNNAIDTKKKQLKKYNVDENEKIKLINLAKSYLPGRVEYYSKLMNVKPSGLKITSAKKRFGSCSGKNSICFSYYLMLYPKEAVDYVVVHELAHIRHHNHSKDFYNFVSEYMPDYKEREKLLKNQN